MEEKTTSIKKIPNFQKSLLGIAIAFYIIYKFWLKDPSIKADLGSWYPWFIQIWTLVMLISAGFSGWYLVMYAPNLKDIGKKNE